MAGLDTRMWEKNVCATFDGANEVNDCWAEWIKGLRVKGYWLSSSFFIFYYYKIKVNGVKFLEIFVDH